MMIGHIIILTSAFGVYCRHQLVPDEELGSLYDLLIDDPPEVRHAIGALVYDHLIAQKFNDSQPCSAGFFQLFTNAFAFFILALFLV